MVYRLLKLTLFLPIVTTNVEGGYFTIKSMKTNLDDAFSIFLCNILSFSDFYDYVCYFMKRPDPTFDDPKIIRFAPSQASDKITLKLVNRER